jgi:uncharacterized repeat protein (TIGR01451 family)
MNTRKALLIVGLLLCLVTALAVPQGAMALGTPACTNIGNTAAVAYSVSGAAQAPVSSPTNTIVVGNKVNHTVVTTDAAAVSVVTGQTATLGFTITNTGNAAEKYSLSYVLVTGGATSVFGAAATDSFDPTGVTTQVASVPTTTTAFVGVGGTLTVTIVGTMPGALTEGWLSVNVLKAQAVNPLTNVVEANINSQISIDGTTLACSSDIVLGDAAGTDDIAKDGIYSARSAYIVHLTTLTVSKTSTPIFDPFNLAVSPKAIPGATMQYTVAVRNAGGTNTATNVSITDTLPATLAPVNPATITGCGSCAGACIEHPATTFTCSGGWGGQTLTATDGTPLATSATTTFVYQATIQ